MRRLPLPRALLAALCLLAAGAGGAQSAGASHAGTGRIVFASDRGRADPGEIYSLGPGSAPRHVAPSPAAEYGLAVSPAGGRIAFWSGRTGSDELYLARADGSHVRLVRGAGREPLRADGAGGGRLTFTADGRRLFGSGAGGAFAVDAGTALARSLPFCERGTVSPAPDGKLVACADAGRMLVSDLAGRVRAGFRGERPLWSSRGWLTNAPGGGPSQPPPSVSVLDASGRAVGVVHGFPVAWSADGRSLLFRRGHSLRISAAAKLAGSRVLVARWDDGPVSLTPDGRYVSTEVRGRAVLIPIAGGKARAGVDGGSGVWSAGGRLAYAALQRQSPPRPGGRVPIYITDAHGRNPRVAGRLAWDYQTLMSLRWLPGARRVLVTTENQCSGTGLFAISPSGGAVQPLNSDQRDLEMPASSPDGRRIAYSVELYNCHTESEAPIQIETVAADGSGARALTAPVSGEERTADVWPAFSPDGRRIAFLHAAGNGGALQTVSAGGGARTAVLPSGDRLTPAWSPDSSRIAFQSGVEIWAVSAAGGAPRRLARIPQALGGSCGGLGIAWSPDGTRFATGGSDGIYVIALGSRPSATLAIKAPCAEYPVFSPDGSQIAFDARPSLGPGSETAIMLANADGSGLRTLTAVPFRQSVHPAWLP